ncbi:hypoxanthine phosphoribosyltransferase [Candidatus Woesearchaeota archaeon]|nr:hypoxanthine phosphoribosyltransferase [Candidatus Woesearchaeota archaeon]
MASPPIDIRNAPPVLPDEVFIPKEYLSDIDHILVRQRCFNERIHVMAEEISRDFEHGNGLAVVVLKGGKYFSDHVLTHRMMNAKFEYRTVRATSYHGTESSGNVALESDISEDGVKNKHVLLFEDIIDTGRTLDAITQHLLQMNPASVGIAAMLDKPERRTVAGIDSFIKYCGWIIPNKFVVGCGLDFDGKYRDLQHIAVLKPEVYHGK